MEAYKHTELIFFCIYWDMDINKRVPGFFPDTHLSFTTMFHKSKRLNFEQRLQLVYAKEDAKHYLRIIMK